MREAMELAAHAQQVGADAIAAMAPCFFKPATVRDLMCFLCSDCSIGCRVAFLLLQYAFYDGCLLVCAGVFGRRQKGDTESGRHKVYAQQPDGDGANVWL